MPETPRGAKPATKTVKKKKAPTASLGMQKLVDVDGLSEEDAKTQLAALQKSYGALIVNFNNQKTELGSSLQTIERLERELEKAEAVSSGGGVPEDKDSRIAKLAEVRAAARACFGWCAAGCRGRRADHASLTPLAAHEWPGRPRAPPLPPRPPPLPRRSDAL